MLFATAAPASYSAGGRAWKASFGTSSLRSSALCLKLPSPAPPFSNGPRRCRRAIPWPVPSAPQKAIGHPVALADIQPSVLFTNAPRLRQTRLSVVLLTDLESKALLTGEL